VNTSRRITAVALAAAAACAPLVAVAAPASAVSAAPRAVTNQGIGIRLLDASVARKNDPRARLYIDDNVAPGTTITRHVEVSNFTAKTAHVLLYADASSINQNGWQVAQGQATNELTSWMTVTPSAASLAPGKSVVATVNIAVPVKASAEERYATIIAELPAPKLAAGQQVAIDSRVGVRVYLSVGAGGEPASNFTISTLVASKSPDGTPMVTANVTNTGKRALDVGGTLMLTNGPGGLRAGPYQVSVPKTIGIGETEGVTVALDKQTPLGPWLATMQLKSGYVEHAATATITFPAKGGSAAAPVKAKPVAHKSSVMLPAVLGAIALVIVALIVLWLRRRRRDDEDTSRGSSSPTPFVPTPREELRREEVRRDEAPLQEAPLQEAPLQEAPRQETPRQTARRPEAINRLRSRQ
jgi:hypothetical protein